MILTDALATFGRYCMFLKRVFAIPDRRSVFVRRTVDEVSKLGIDSIPPRADNLGVHPGP